MTGPTQSTVDELLRGLAHPLRRRLLEVLAARRADNGQCRLETTDFVQSVTDDEAFVRSELYHVHLPKLEATDLVERVDPDAVRPGPRFDQATRLLREVPGTRV
jgi:hypothetical protein